MFPAASSAVSAALFDPTLFDERAIFLTNLDQWTYSGFPDEQAARKEFAQKLTIAFDIKARSFSSTRNAITSLPSCIGALTEVEELDLSFCDRLTSLPPEIGNLTALKRLDLLDCASLNALPPEIGNLTALKRLDLNGCASLNALPPEIGRLTDLESLDLSECTSLTALPPEIGRLTDLESLDLSGCTNLTALPPEIGNLTALKSLYLSDCASLNALPPEIGNLTALEDLFIVSCTGLSDLPTEIGDLTELQQLYLNHCTSLRALPPEIGRLTKLRDLYLPDCTSLRALPPEIGKLYALEILSLEDCTHLSSLPLEIGNILMELSLDFCFVCFEGCPNLALQPLETITLTDLHRLERQEFVTIFNKFLLLFKEKEFIAEGFLHTEIGASEPTVATGRFIKEFKERIIARRLQNMQKEFSKICDAISYVADSRDVPEDLHVEDRGTPLPLVVLECFLAQDARVHCLRLTQENEDRLL